MEIADLIDEEAMEEIFHHDQIEHDIVATRILDNQIKSLPLTKLETIARDETVNKLYRARFKIEALASQTASDTLQIVDPQSHTMRPLKEDAIIRRSEVLAISFKVFVKENIVSPHYYQL